MLAKMKYNYFKKKSYIVIYNTNQRQKQKVYIKNIKY